MQPTRDTIAMHASILSVSCIVLILVASASAASTDAAGHAFTKTLPEEIVVTARRRSERPQDVPISTMLYSETLLQELVIRDLTDIQYQTPNLQIAAFPAVSADASIAMRGQSQFEPVITLDPAVAIYVDGVYLGRPTGALLNLVDLHRVEVLLGPQGTLYGKNTTGGVIHLISKKNTDHRFGGRLNIRAGNFGRNDYLGVIDLPVVKGKLAARASFQSTNRDGFGSNVELSEELENEQAQSWRFNLNWHPREDLEVFVSLDKTRQRERSSLYRINTLDPQLLEPDCLIQTTPLFGCFVNSVVTGGNWASALAGDNRAIRSDVSSRHDVDVSGISATVTAALEHYSIRSISAYRELERRNINDIDGTEWTILHPDANADQRQFSQELQVFGKAADSRADWIAGLFFFDESGNDNTIVESVPALNPFSPSTILPHGENTSIAAFGHVTYAVGTQTNVTAGTRYTRERRELSAQQFNAAGCTLEFVNRPPCRTEVAKRFDGWSYVLGADHHWTDNLMAYVTTSRGFKSGGFNARASKEFEFRPFNPEIVTSYEVGLKTTLLNDRLRMDVAYFYSDFTDIQRAGLVALSQTDIASTVKNAASAYVTGGEFRATLSGENGFLWDLAVGSTIARYRVFEDSDALGNSIDKSSLRFPKTPKWSFSSRLQYKKPFWSSNELTLQAAYSWQSKTHPDVDNAPEIAQGAFGLLDLRVSALIGDLNAEIALAVKNANDEVYVTDGLDFSDQFGYTGVFFGPPRTYAVDINWRFGS